MNTNNKYQYLDSLNRKNTLSLVRNSETGEILTARTVSYSQVSPYKKLLGIHIPHVPYVYEIVQDSEHEYTVYSDYIEGRNLHDYLTLKGNCTVSETVYFASKLCETLSALRVLGIVHRDIKPENVIVTDEKEIYLIDFDISRLEKKSAERDTSVLGTAGYAAPEQFGFAQSDHRTDLYALGVLINVMMTGSLPSEKKAIGRIGAIVEKCMQIDPQNRYKNADELKNDLLGINEKHDWKDVLHSIPGYRSYNLFYAIIATVLYLMAFMFLIVFVQLAMESVTNFLVVLYLLINICFYYVFGFDCFKLRTKCNAVESYHNSKMLYFVLCVLIAGGFTLISTLVLTIIWGILLG